MATETLVFHTPATPLLGSRSRPVRSDSSLSELSTESIFTSQSAPQLRSKGGQGSTAVSLAPLPAAKRRRRRRRPSETPIHPFADVPFRHAQSPAPLPAGYAPHASLAEAQSVPDLPALPATMPMMPSLTPHPLIQARWQAHSLKLDHAIENKLRRAHQKRRVLLESLESKYSRPLRRAEERMRLDWVRAWLVAVMHTHVAAVYFPKAKAAIDDARYNIQLNEASRKISQLFSRTRVRREFRHLAQFLAKVDKYRWYFRMQLRCWRRNSQANLMRRFILDAHKIGASVKVVQMFSRKVRRVQRWARFFLSCSWLKQQLLLGMLEEIEADILCEQKKKVREACKMTTITVSTGAGAKERAATDEINTSLVSWSILDRRFNSLLEDQDRKGRLLRADDQPGIRALPDGVKRALVWQMLHDRRRQFRLMEGELVAKLVAKAKADAVLTEDHVRDIIFPASGRVKRVDLTQDNYQGLKPFYTFWTAYKPASVCDVLRRLYLAKQRALYGDLVNDLIAHKPRKPTAAAAASPLRAGMVMQMQMELPGTKTLAVNVTPRRQPHPQRNVGVLSDGFD